MISLFSRFMRSVMVVLVTLVASLETLYRVFVRKGEGVDEIFREWGQEILELARVRVHVEGLEHLPKEPGLILFHHASLLDIPVLYASLPGRRIRFGAKSELFKIPIFGRTMRSVGTLSIERGDPQQVRQLYEKVAKERPDGIDFALAPEGTRQALNAIGPFKTGPFVFAISAQTVIVPVVIAHASEVLSKTDWIFQSDGIQIRIRVLPPFQTQGLRLEDRMRLKQKVREAMMQALNELTSSSRLGQGTSGGLVGSEPPLLPN